VVPGDAAGEFDEHDTMSTDAIVAPHSFRRRFISKSSQSDLSQTFRRRHCAKSERDVSAVTLASLPSATL